MSHCLTEPALARLLAELGTPAERSHLAACTRCVARYRRAEVELSEIAQVLIATPEARGQATRATAGWVTAAVAVATAVVVVGVAWISMEPTARVEHRLAPAEDLHNATALADIGIALFSVDGEPRAPAAQLETDAAHETGCEATARIAGIYCAGPSLDLDERSSAFDLEMKEPLLRGDGRDEGA